MNDIERLLDAAANDDDRSQNISVEAILQRGRRAVRRSRFAVVASTALAAIAVTAVAPPAISALRGPQGASDTQVAAADGTDTAGGGKAVPPPPVSLLKHIAILMRCQSGDKEARDLNKRYGVNTFDKAGPIDAKWTLAVKSGVGDAFTAIFVSPDRSIAATCHSAGAKGQFRGSGVVDRASTTYVVKKGNPHNLTMTQARGIQVPKGVTRVLVDVPGEKLAREALLSQSGGFFTIGWPHDDESKSLVMVRIRGYDAKGAPVFDEKAPYQAQRIPPLGKR
ncbi:hypothetical protein GCM10029976_042940 [Kribbella albertanoniae]|uniref:Uncharacterized protein n=1 Tax=Kribbella albertanoniae TaxID=1266829 RepID=A0A4R4Q717_9ACTN|nr:hypothetical protein [Kribbella albertanoniae]TDC30978.1 hypothetical protein E1261_12015 [Kribbella albertanoniae]